MTHQPVQEAPKPPRQRWWTSVMVWTATGAVVGTLSLLVAFGAWWFPQARESDARSSVANTYGAKASPNQTTAQSPQTPPTGPASAGASGASGSPTGSGPASRSPLVASSPPSWVHGPAVVYITGTPTLMTRPTNDGTDPAMWSLEKNSAGSAYDVDNGYAGNNEVMLIYDALGTLRGAALARWTGAARPTLAGCGTVPDAEWVASIANADLANGQFLCVISNGRRYGYLTLHSVRRYTEVVGPAPAGGLSRVSFSYVLWQKPSD